MDIKSELDEYYGHEQYHNAISVLRDMRVLFNTEAGALKSPSFNDTPHSTNTSNPTAISAERIIKLADDVRLQEQVVDNLLDRRIEINRALS